MSDEPQPRFALSLRAVLGAWIYCGLVALAALLLAAIDGGKPYSMAPYAGLHISSARLGEAPNPSAEDDLADEERGVSREEGGVCSAHRRNDPKYHQFLSSLPSQAGWTC